MSPVETPEHWEGKTLNGHQYVVALQPRDMPILKLQYPQATVFSRHEIGFLKGMTREESETILIAKKVFGGVVVANRELKKRQGRRRAR